MPSLTFEKLPKSRTTVTIEVPADMRMMAEEKALAKLGGDVRLPGFRPGKAPLNVLKEKLDADAVIKETAHQLLPALLKQAMEEGKLSPILPPRVQILSDEPLKLQFLFVEFPSVKVSDRGLKLPPKQEVTVTPHEVDRTIRQLLWHERKEKEEERAAQKDDLVRVDIIVTDAKKAEVPELTQRNVRILLGSDDQLPELDAGIEGMKKGETKALTLTIPKTFPDPANAGRKLTFTVTLHSVTSVSTPDLTDAYLEKQFGSKKTPTQFKEDVQKMIMERKKRDADQKREQEFFDAVKKNTKVELVDELVDSEVQSMLNSLQSKLKESDMTFDDWIQQTGKKPEEVVTDMKQTANDRLTVRLGTQQLIKDNSIEAPDEAVAKRAKEMMTQAHAQGQHVHEGQYEQGGSGYDQIKYEMQVEKLMEKFGV